MIYIIILNLFVIFITSLTVHIYYFHSRHLDAPSSGRHHLSPAKHAHSHHTLAHSPTTDGTLDKSENPKKVDT